MNKQLLATALLCLSAIACEDDKAEELVQTVQADRAGITGIVIDQDDLLVENDAGQARQLSVTATREGMAGLNYSDRVDWQSSDERVATISDSGLLTPTGAGVATITVGFARFRDGLVATVSDAELVSISLTPNSVTLDECRSTAVTASGNYDDGTTRSLNGVQWRSDDEAVASVPAVDADRATLFTHKAGTATLTASRGDISTALSLVASEALTSIEITPLSLQLELNKSAALTATGVYSDGSRTDISEAASWSIPAEAQRSTLTLDNLYPGKGGVTATAVGTAAVQAECGDTIADAASSVTVTEAVTLERVAFDEDDDPLLLNTDDEPRQLRLLASYSDGSENDVTEQAEWEILTGDDDLISVSNSSGDKGEVTFASAIDDITEAKEVTIRATFEDEDDQITIRVLVP